MPFQIDGRGDMNAFVLTSRPIGVMLLTRRQPFYPSAAHDKFFSICTAFGGYTKFGIAPYSSPSHKSNLLNTDAKASAVSIYIKEEAVYAIQGFDIMTVEQLNKLA